MFLCGCVPYLYTRPHLHLQTCLFFAIMDPRGNHVVAQCRVQVVLTDWNCVICGSPADPSIGPCAAGVFEDPTRKVISPPGVVDRLYGPLTPTEEYPVSSENRWICAYHLTGDCKRKMHQLRLALMAQRVHVPQVVVDQLSRRRISTSEYIATHHSAKLDITRAYPECDQLTVLAVGVDQNPTNANMATSIGYEEFVGSTDPLDHPLTLQNVFTSYVMYMPLGAAQSLVIRTAAWNRLQMWGLFQSVAIVNITLNGTKSTPAQQVAALQRSAEAVLGPRLRREDVIGAIFAHRLPNTNSAELGKTTWQLVVRLDVHNKPFDALWSRFYRDYLHPDSVLPNFLTWAQAFDNAVLDSTSINAQAVVNNPYYLPGGGREITKMVLTENWLKGERDQFWAEMDSAMEELLARFSRDLIPSGMAPLQTVKTMRVNAQSVSNKATTDNTLQETFIYRVNAQEVITRPGVQSSENYFCLPMAGNDLQCWAYDFNNSAGVDPSTIAPGPGETMHIPIMYSNAALHNQFMTDSLMVQVPLDSLTMIYHAIPGVVAGFNNAHSTPPPAPTQIPPPPNPAPAIPPVNKPNPPAAYSDNGQIHPASIEPAQFAPPRTIGDPRPIPLALNVNAPAGAAMMKTRSKTAKEKEKEKEKTKT